MLPAFLQAVHSVTLKEQVLEQMDHLYYSIWASAIKKIYVFSTLIYVIYLLVKIYCSKTDVNQKSYLLTVV